MTAPPMSLPASQEAVIGPPAGLSTMSPEMANCRAYYEWVYAAIEPSLGWRVLEVGPGFGMLAELILEAGKTYFAIDTDQQVIDHLQRRLDGYGSRASVVCDDLTRERVIEFFKAQAVDTVNSMNVLEHLQDHMPCLMAQRQVLRKGHVISFVPAHQQLYGVMDKQAGHYRRYSRADLLQLYQNAALEGTQVRYFNALGAVGWFISGRMCGAGLEDRSTQVLIRLYRQGVLPLARLLDSPLNRWFGQSAIAVGRVGSTDELR